LEVRKSWIVENKNSDVITNKKGTAMKDLIKTVAKALVDHPDQVIVTEIEGKQITVLELEVAKEDIGKVIGKQGRTAHAIRLVLGAASAKEKKRTILKIIE
jgi:hypothetical protein